MGITLTYVPHAWKIHPIPTPEKVIPEKVIPESVAVSVVSPIPPISPISPIPPIPPVLPPAAAPEVVPAPIANSPVTLPGEVSGEDVCERVPIRMSSDDESVQIIKFDNLQFYILVGLFALYIVVVAMKSNSMYL
jgi:hypothetical protein